MYNISDRIRKKYNQKMTRTPWWKQVGFWIGIVGIVVAVIVPIYLQPNPQALSPSIDLTNTPTNTPSPQPKTKTPTPSPPTQTPTPNNTNTKEPTATPKPDINSVEIESWNRILSDSFNTNVNDWVTGKDADQYSSSHYQVIEGVYRWEAEANQGFIGWNYPDIRNLTNFYLSIDAKQIQGEEDACYGLVFRNKDDNNLYNFCINSMGEYKVERLFKDHWEYLVYWKNSPHIRPWQKNTLSVFALGPQLKFYINGELVAETEDDLLTKGKPAICVEMYDKGDKGVFMFDNFIVSVPPASE